LPTHHKKWPRTPFAACPVLEGTGIRTNKIDNTETLEEIALLSQQNKNAFVFDCSTELLPEKKAWKTKHARLDLKTN
jgi:hypothetical protein